VSVSIAVAVAVAVAGLTAGAVLAAVPSHARTDQRVDRQAAVWTRTAAAGTDRWQPVNWQDLGSGSTGVSGPLGLTLSADGAISLSFNASFVGGPVEVRAMDSGHRMLSGVARFAPTPNGRAFSFTFVRNGGHPVCGRHVNVQWRLATAAAASLTHADAVVTYKRDTTDHGQVGCL
jgi:hypothetical protein